MTALEKIHQTNTLNLRETESLAVMVKRYTNMFLPHLVEILNPNGGIKAKNCADGEICHLIHPLRCLNIF